MNEIVKLFCDNSDGEMWFGETNSSLRLTMRPFYIELSFTSPQNNEIEELDEDEIDDLGLTPIEDINEFLTQNLNKELSEIRVSLYEYLGHSEDLEITDKDDDLKITKRKPRSSAKTLFKTIKKIRNQIPGLSINYRFETLHTASSLYCSAKPDYYAGIFIAATDLKIEETNFLILILKSTEEEYLEEVYWTAYFEKEHIKNSYENQFINTNTKVRRLGYLKIFFELIDERKKIPITFVNRKFEEYAVQYTQLLSESEYSKGLIQLLNGKSAGPYVELLKEFHLIENLNRLIVPSKRLKVYLELSKKYNTNKHKNPFLLTDFDKLFFLEIILQEDYLYSFIILELLYLNESPSVKYIVENFQLMIVKRLSDFLLQNSEEFDRKKVNKIKTITRRIEGWKKADVYLEHIIMPRINWFADLGLIHISGDNKITFLSEGIKLSEELFSWIDIASEFIANSQDFLKRFYPHIASLSYRKTLGIYPTEQQIHELIVHYINESFLLFKTLAPNRVTSSQAFAFTKYSFYFNQGFCVTEKYLERIIQQKFSNLYIYKFQQQYGDGYIQKIKN